MAPAQRLLIHPASKAEDSTKWLELWPHLCPRGGGGGGGGGPNLHPEKASVWPNNKLLKQTMSYLVQLNLALGTLLSALIGPHPTFPHGKAPEQECWHYSYHFLFH